MQDTPAMIYLHKILPLIVSPLGLIFLLLALALLIRKFWPVSVALLSLFICSVPLAANSVWKHLESNYPYKAIHEVETTQAVVVLGGMVSAFNDKDGYVLSWGDPDRFFAGIDLIKANKAAKIIFTRGKLPWSDQPPEGELLRIKAIEMGLSDSQIELTDVVANTAEEALAVKKLCDSLNVEKVILVTSSFHMPRAKLLFDAVGLQTFPFATDFRANKKDLNWRAFIPNADAFRMTSAAIREIGGLWYYNLTIRL